VGEKGEKTKRKILEKACDLFYLKGYRGTSVEDILRASRINKGNFYFHFKSKEELGRAVIDSYAAKTFLSLRKALNANGSPLEGIYRLFYEQEKILKASGWNGGCPFGNLAIELADHHPGFRVQLDLVFDAWAREIKTALDKARKEKQLKKSIDSRAMSRFIVAALEGSALLAKTKKKREVYRHCVESLRFLLENSKK
jgi:AcrR family transcriptional regulator